MAGITDLPFRLICKEMGANIVYSEMISAAGIYYNQKKTLDFLQTDEREWPVFFQLFGSDPKHFAKAAEIINEKFKNQKENIGIDINFGCPVKKVIKQESGCALMEKPDISGKIIKAVSENTNLPISIKIRAGYKKIDAIQFLDDIADFDWKTVTIHGRTFSQGFSGPVDFNIIKKIKQKFPTKTVIANGNVYCPEDAVDLLQKTGADGIAIARGAMGNPWIFGQIKDFLESAGYRKPDLEEIKKTALKHARLMKKYKGENSAVEMRKHLGWYFKNIPDAKRIRNLFFSANNFQQIRAIINKI